MAVKAFLLEILILEIKTWSDNINFKFVVIKMVINLKKHLKRPSTGAPKIARV